MSGEDGDDLGDKYSISFSPQYWIKFRKSRGAYDFGLDVSPTAEERPVKLVFKPFGEQWRKKRWWSKVELYPFERDVRVYTRKVDYGPLNLQLVADHCIGTMRSGVHWRVGTNFLQGGSKQKLKYPLYSDEDLQADLNMHWNAEIAMPNMEGGITGAGGQVEIATGHCHLDVPKIDAKIRFMPRPRGSADKGTSTSLSAGAKEKERVRSPDSRTHVVQKDEWLSSIARRYGMSTEKLRSLNAKEIGEDDLIFPGQKLSIK